MQEIQPRSRIEVVEFIREQLVGDDPAYELDRDKKLRYHYGLQELRQLMDYIYTTAPTEEEELNVKTWPREERTQAEEWEAKQKERTIGNYSQGSIL